MINVLGMLVNNDLSTPLNVQMYAQTILQNVTLDSVEWAFRQADATGTTGLMLAHIGGINCPALRSMPTMEAVVENEVAMGSVAGNEAAMGAVLSIVENMKKFISHETMASVITSSEAAMITISHNISLMNAISLNANFLQQVAYSSFAYTITLSPYNNEFFVNAVINTCRSNSIPFRQVAVSSGGSQTTNVEVNIPVHNINTDTWVRNIAEPWLVTPMRGIYAFRRVMILGNTILAGITTNRIDSVSIQLSTGNDTLVNRVIFGLLGNNPARFWQQIPPNAPANSTQGNVFLVTPP